MATETRSGGKRNKGTPKKPKYIKTAPEPIVIKPRGKFVCQWCNNTYSSENIMLTHMCEHRRRFNQKDTPAARLGFIAFNEINTQFAGNSQRKSEEEFRHSVYYLACMRWGRFMTNVGCRNSLSYVAWLLERKVSIDKWSDDEVYESWLQYYGFAEDAWEATQHSIEFMAAWAEETGVAYHDYFRSAGGARVLSDVRKGKISAWVIFCSDSGREWLASLSQGDLELVWYFLDPTRWQAKLKNDAATTEITSVCKQAGL